MTGGMTWWPSSAGARPRFATQRDLSRPTDGDQVALVALALGTPLLPWQRHVADVAGERRPDGSYEYQTIVVSVPRQTGKTTLIHAMGVHRAGFLGRDVFYTAQTGKDARARWMDLVQRLGKSETHSRIKGRVSDIALRGGSEHIEFTHTTSASGRKIKHVAVFQAFAPTQKALHGYTPPTVVLDEAFAHGPAAGELLMGAIDPAQFTIVDKQIWIVSTRGTAESTFLHDWIARGVEGTPRVAVFDWGAADDHNPYDAHDVALFHPGVGFQLGDKIIVPDDVLGSIEKNTRAEYERAYANRPTLTSAHLITVDEWRSLGPEKGQQLPPPNDTRSCVLSYDVALDRLSSTVVATWLHDGETPRAKVVMAGPGTGWLADAVEELHGQWRPLDTVAAGNGPVLEVTQRLVDRGVDVTVLNEREYASASGGLLTHISESTLEHDGSDELERSVTGLVVRPGAIDGVAISRRQSVGDTSAAVALAVGIWGIERHARNTKPMVRFG